MKELGITPCCPVVAMTATFSFWSLNLPGLKIRPTNQGCEVPLEMVIFSARWAMKLYKGTAVQRVDELQTQKVLQKVLSLMDIGL